MTRLFLDRIEDWTGQGVLSVLGPTGSGKTAGVLNEARRRWPQNPKTPLLVSIDSVAVYRGLDIGSAKPLGTERQGFDWVGIDVASPDERVSAADFARLVSPHIENARGQSRPVILVGGSHFYERALVQGMSPGEASDPAFTGALAALTNAELHARLAKFDRRWAARLHPNDRYRLARYLDLVERQGLSFDALSASVRAPKWGETATLLMGVHETPAGITDRMRKRIASMLAQGWVDETRTLLKNHSRAAPSLQSVGYREIVEFLGGSLPESELAEKILIGHMQLAKKQRTWLRGLRKT